MRVVISEKQEQLLNELMWKSNTITHIENLRIPLTKKIYNILYGKKVVKTFHITDAASVNKIKGIIGTNKTISTFKKYPNYLLYDLSGIQTKGGVMMEIIGDLVLESNRDIMSRPDENGYRWVDLSYISKELKNRWEDNIDKYDLFHNINVKSLRTTTIKNYFKQSEKFIYDYKDEIIKELFRIQPYMTEWDEILVSNIRVNDVLLNKTTLSMSFFYLKDDKDINLFNNYLNKLTNRLLNIIEGDVYIEDEINIRDTINKFKSNNKNEITCEVIKNQK